MKRLWILGAKDPEMAKIETILLCKGERFFHAMKNGKRVHNGNAYQTDYEFSAKQVDDLVLVECGFKTQTANMRYIDHHKLGDFGYRKPPEQYFEASSIGQTINFLSALNINVQITQEIRMIAATDHCLMAAYQGKCPKIDPDILMKWRVEKRAHYKNITIEKMYDYIRQAIEALHAAPKIYIHGSDNRIYPVSDFGNHTVRELPEAACRMSMAFTATVSDKAGRRKRILQCGCPELIEGWMQDAKNKMDEVYGDPIRGFAGGYLR